MPETGRGFELNQLQKQAEATTDVANHLIKLEERIQSLEETIADSAISSGRVAKALNWLTLVLVLIGAVGLYLEYFGPE